MKRALSAFETVAAAFLLAIALLTFCNVALRETFGRQVPDWFDLSKQLQAIAMFWGIALATCAAATSAWTCCGNSARKPAGAASTWRPPR
jgi:TRAP-type C4-dicarboxylate transport system permease small subunit